MPFIDLATLEYPLSEADIRRRHPSTLLPTPFVAPKRYAPVFASPTPAFDAETQHMVEVQPAQRKPGGPWFQQWSVVDIQPEDKESQ